MSGCAPMNRLAVMFVVLVVSLLPALAQAKTRLIHYGWDNPNVSALPSILPKLRKSVFDGISVSATNGNEIFRATAWPPGTIDADIKILNSIDRTLLKNSYIYVLAKTDVEFDWTNDIHWNASMANMRLLAQLAKRGGFKGIVYDMEPYGKSPWDYTTQPAHSNFTYTQMSALVRKRGADMMRILQQEFPGLQVWALFGLTANAYDHEEVAAGRTVADVLSTSGYGLWPHFYSGWFDARTGKTTIVDGNEPAYYYTKRKQFQDAKTFVSKTLAVLINKESRSRYQANVKLGHSVYVDGVMNLHGSPRFIGYYFKSDKERAQLLYSNTVNALQTSESIVWIYAEKAKWWQGPPRADIDKVLRNAKRDAAIRTTPLTVYASVNAAAKELSESVSIGGTFTTAEGKGVAPTGFGSILNTAACGTWGDRGEYSCQFPEGSTVTITPKLDGKTFAPPSRTFGNLQKNNWGVNWTVQ
jgi:hypothetical protein